MEDDRTSELIEAEDIEVTAHKRTRKKKATYECPSCKLTENPYFIKDNDAKLLVPHSYVSASLATHVMYSKFINAMPYHRQEKDFFTQYGIKISRGTMAHWTIFWNSFCPRVWQSWMPRCARSCVLRWHRPAICRCRCRLPSMRRSS